MSKKEKIQIIITGGTIDSFYDAPKDTVSPLHKSSLPDFIKSLKMKDFFSFHQVCMNGQIFSPSEVIKRISEGKFVSVFNKN